MSIRIRTIAAMVLAVGALAACSLFKDFGKVVKDCKGTASCAVDVTVTNCVPTTADIIRVAKAGPPVEIRWQAPPGFAFTREGVQFETSPVIDTRRGIEREGTSWVVVDTPNGQTVTSKYRLQLRTTAGPAAVCTGPDPVIIND